MSELHEECGIAAVIISQIADRAPYVRVKGPSEVARLIPRMLLDIQNRGQLAAGITSYNPHRDQLIDTHKDIGTVAEVFRLSHRGKSASLMERYTGPAGIGHVRYATCGKEDRSYAQPFERHHLQRHKWFSFAFNGQLANYAQLREELLRDGDHHLTRETDTEIIMHELSRQLHGDSRPSLVDVMRHLSQKFDGSYCLTLLNARGELLIARDPLGIKPLCYAFDGALFAAASESVALVNLGFAADQVRSLPAGYAVTVEGGEVQVQRYADADSTAYCFFEWIYFANVASTMDDRSVYVTRRSLGEELADLERASDLVPMDDDTIVVPVPDTSKAAADAMAFHLGIPSREGLIRNRYSGRTFIEGSNSRKKAAQSKYTPLPEVLSGKRVLLVEDSIVRSTTMRVLLERIRREGDAREIHVRVACPPIVAPCFYGIDMSRIDELFAPKFLKGGALTPEIEREMAAELGADSLRYLPVEAISRAIDKPANRLCQACITGTYPTACGQQLYDLAQRQVGHPQADSRTYEAAGAIQSK